MNTTGFSAERIWDRLFDQIQVNAWEHYAEWTIPSVFPRINQSELKYDYQSSGAFFVNSLASKLTQTLFPPNNSFFKLDAGDVSDLDEDLARIELASSSQLFSNASYAALTYAMQMLIITGNALLVRKDGKFHVHSPREYVVDRDYITGDVRCIILKQSVTELDLTDHAKMVLGISPMAYMDSAQKAVKTFDLYTVVRWDKDAKRWYEEQYIDGKAVHSKVGEYIENLCPYIPVRWSTRPTEWFGRGHVELYAGDFVKLSELSRALTDYEAMACNVKILSDPAGNTDVQELESPISGLVVQGQPQSVAALEIGDYQKIQALQGSIQMITQRLAVAFMQTTNQRQGERVTAYEVEVAAREAEQTLGSVYSQLALSLHLPLAYLLCYELDHGIGTDIAKGALEVQIITGVQALSRSSELQQWVALTQELGLIIPTLQQVSPRFNVEKIIEQFMLGHGISREFLYTEAEMAAIIEKQQAELERTQYQDRHITSQDATGEMVEQLGQV